MNVAAEYDVNDRSTAGVDGFLQELALVADSDGRKDDQGVVTLMSLHNAKGLEYPVVFILGMEDGVFPHSRSFDEGTVEEERRLAYVGITRAKERFVPHVGAAPAGVGQTKLRDPLAVPPGVPPPS